MIPGPSSRGAGEARQGDFVPTFPPGACLRRRTAEILADRLIDTIGRLSITLEALEMAHRFHGCTCPCYPCILDQPWGRGAA